MADRTHEFTQFVEKFQGNNSVTKKIPEVPKTKSAFHDASADIARGIHRTSGLLTKLTKLVRRQGLFDDPTEEINNLIFRIKQDLDELNTKCDSAQQFVDSKKKAASSDQSASYNLKVVGQLKTDLMNTTKEFKSVLEARSSKMKDQMQRKVALTGQGSLSPMRQFNASKQPEGPPKPGSELKVGGGSGGDASPYGLQQSSDSHLAVYAQQQQQLLLAPPASVQYYESREQAVTEVEKTIGELGTLFKRLATMIAEQQELVERIDEDVEEAVHNSEKAHTLLLKAYENASSNKALYTKLGAILAVFGIFFVIFLM